MNRAVELEILGQRLVVASDDGEGHVREVGRMVDERARQLAGQFPQATLIQLALLTALNIASECWKLNCDRADLDEHLNRLSAALAEQSASTGEV